MSVTKKYYGEYRGKDVYKYTLDNQNGLSAEIINYGGIITKLVYNGVDIVWGRTSLDEYFNNQGYFGAIIGRNANRIENARFDYDGHTYLLCQNAGEHNLHGGNEGFDKKLWNEDSVDDKANSITLSITSDDGEEGFPGNVEVKVKYSVSDDSLVIEYEGSTDKDTVINMTNHSYFNLNGHNSGSVTEHKLIVLSDFYTPNSGIGLPNGEIRSVSNTIYDFTSEKALSEIVNVNEMFDQNYIISQSKTDLAARLIGDKSGIIMEVYTDNKGLQVYVPRFADEKRLCKENSIYVKYGAICLEAQAVPNNLKYSHFPSSIVKEGEKYSTYTRYKFYKSK